MKSLNDMKIGESATVLGINGENALRHRIMRMGVTKGTDITLLKKAPLGDPLEILVRGYHLSLRKKEAVSIGVMGGNHEN